MKRKHLRSLALVFAIVLVLSLGFFFLRRWDSARGMFEPQETGGVASNTVTYQGKNYVLKEHLETVLVIGLDSFEETASETSYNNTKQADFMMLFVLDDEASTCTAIHIDRDTMAQMNVLGVAGDKVGTVTKQIALAHNYGNGKEVSCRNVADAVSQLLHGITVDHYVSLTMDAVPLYTDLVGGVELEVQDDFSGIDDTLVKGETVRLDGARALTYIRGRYGVADGTNQNRMVRQRQFAGALAEQTRLYLQKDGGFASSTVLKLMPYLVSDCSTMRLQTLLEKIGSYSLTGMVKIEGTSKVVDDYLQFYPDEEALRQTVLDTFYSVS